MVAYLGLGANLGPREETLSRALAALEGPALHVRRRSSLYETEPLGVTEQPRFLNAVAEVHTGLGPCTLLARCKATESALGRVPRRRWGPREIDLDVLIYGDWVIRTPELVVPHPRLRERDFALRPLAELAPQGVDPQSGRPFARLAAAVRDEKKVRLSRKS